MPFTSDQFFNVFNQYNTGVWPMQIILYLLGLTALGAAIWKFRFSIRRYYVISDQSRHHSYDCLPR